MSERWPFALIWLNSGLEVTTNFNQGNVQQSPSMTSLLFPSVAPDAYFHWTCTTAVYPKLWLRIQPTLIDHNPHGDGKSPVGIILGLALA